MDKEKGTEIIRDVFTLIEEKIGPDPRDAYSCIANLAGIYLGFMLPRDMPMEQIERLTDEFLENVKTIARGTRIAIAMESPADE